MTEDQTREQADIRIYTDNDKAGEKDAQGNAVDRWQLVPDLPDAPEGEENSALEFAKQTWYDHINMMYRRKGYIGTQKEKVLASTYTIRLPEPFAGGQNPNRETITVGNSLLLTYRSLMQVKDGRCEFCKTTT